MKKISNAHAKSIEKVLDELRTSSKGISTSEVLDRQKDGNKNSFEAEKKQSLASKFFAQFKDIMVIILIVSAVISITIAVVSKEYQNLFEGGIILFIVILNATFGEVQENKAEHALESLKKQTEPYCNVMRDGAIQNIKVEDLVVGDVVILSSGNILPADVRLIETHNFRVDESSLTGESVQVEKMQILCLTNTRRLQKEKIWHIQVQLPLMAEPLALLLQSAKIQKWAKLL